MLQQVQKLQSCANCGQGIDIYQLEGVAVVEFSFALDPGLGESSSLEGWLEGVEMVEFPFALDPGLGGGVISMLRGPGNLFRATTGSKIVIIC